MSMGLRVWDSNNNIVVDINDRLLKYAGSYSTYFPATGIFAGVPPASVNIYVPGITNNGTWAVYCAGGPYSNYSNPSISANNVNIQGFSNYGETIYVYIFRY